MKVLYTLIPALVFFLVGCAEAVSPLSQIPNAKEPNPPSVTLNVDTSYSDAERAQLGEAARIWRLQTSGLANIKLVYDLEPNGPSFALHKAAGHHVVARLESWMPIMNVLDDTGGLLGFVMPPGGIHTVGHQPLVVGFVMDRLNGSEKGDISLTQVALHEFGHVLGIPHAAQYGCTMYPSAMAHEAICLKQADLAAFCAVNVCGTYKMYPCE
jgi:hypothetical protein